MKLKKKIAALSTLLILQSFGVNAAEVDREIAVFAAEQDKTNEEVEVFSRESLNNDKDKTKTKDELKAEEKRLEKEREEARKKIKEERKKSRAELKGKAPISKNPAPVVRAQKNNSNSNAPKNISADSKVEETPAIIDNPPSPNVNPVTNVQPLPEIPAVADVQPVQTVKPVEQSQNFSVQNPIVNHASFVEVVKTVNFTPLYIPKKIGYTINSMATIDNSVAEIRYSSKINPKVALNIRTYRRAAGEELRDISGVQGVKWRVNASNGITTYIAKINENNHVAAWAIGNYTFSAYAENLSFAEFYSLVADELVDLSQHYYPS